MKAIQTGMGVAWMKAAAMLYPKEKRIIEDPYSENLLSPFYKFWIKLMYSPKVRDSIINSKEKAMPGLLGWMFCRFKYIDDILQKYIKQDNIVSVVNLGAGYDCRAYYTKGIEKVKYYEIDHPVVIKNKKRKIKKILGELPEHVKYVAIDFEKQDLAIELTKAGYDLNDKTLFIYEGVSQYISEEANQNNFKYMQQAANNSKIVFTYIIKDFIDGKEINNVTKKEMYKYMCNKNNPLWVFGLNSEHLKKYLEQYSFKLVEDIGSTEVKERISNINKLKLSIFEIERLALAELIK